MADGGGGAGSERALGVALDDERFVVVRVSARDDGGAAVVVDEPLAVGLAPDGSAVSVGAPALVLDEARRATGFVSALGRAEPFVVGGTPYGAEALIAQVLRSAVDGADRSGGEPVGLASPVAADDRYRGDLVVEAVRLAAVGDVVVVPVGLDGGVAERAEAAARAVLAERPDGRLVRAPVTGRLPLLGAGAAAAAGLAGGAALAGAGPAGAGTAGASLADFAGEGSTLGDFSAGPSGSTLGDFAAEPASGGGSALRDFASPATPPSAPVPPAKPKPKVSKPVLAAVGAVVAVAAIAAVAVAATSGSDDPPADEGAAPAVTTTTEADATTTAPSTTARTATGGILFAFAGSGERGTGGDGGPALDAELTVPLDVAVGADGRVYIVDRDGPVRVVATDGRITTLFDTDDLSEPSEIAVAPDGTVYVADNAGGRIVRRAPDGAVTTVMGAKGGDFAEEGDVAADAQLGASGVDLAVDPDGNLIVADSSTRDLFRIVDGRVRVLMGAGENRADRDGLLATDAHVDDALIPEKVDVAPNGDLFVSSRRALWRIGAADGRLRRLAGLVDRHAQEDEVGGAADPARETRISMRDIAVRPDGSVLIAEIQPYQIRVVGPDGVLRPFATGTTGPAPTFRPNGIAIGPDGAVYLANGTNGPPVVQKLPAAGSVG